MSRSSGSDGRAANGGALCRDGQTARRQPKLSPEQSRLNEQERLAQRNRETKIIRIHQDLYSSWERAGKPQGAFNRWLTAVGYAALETRSAASAAEVAVADVADMEKAKARHKQLEEDNPRVNCKFTYPYCFACFCLFHLNVCVIGTIDSLNIHIT